MSSSAIVHVIGTGTIGEPLIGLLVGLKDELGIEEVTFHKRTPLAADRSRIQHLMDRGAKLVVFDPRRSETAAAAAEWIPIKPSTDAAVAMAHLES